MRSGIVIGCGQADDGDVTREGGRDRQFAMYATLYGVKPEDLGRAVAIGGMSYTLIGLVPGSGRFPFVVQCANGKIHKVTQAAVCKALGHVRRPRARRTLASA